MNLKDIINAINVADIKREELARVEDEYEKALKQYQIVRLFIKQKSDEVFAKEKELHNCSHPLSIQYDYSWFDLTHFNMQCVCCGYLYDGLKCKVLGDYLKVETLLYGEEPKKICGFIRQRLVEISESNPNISLEETINIIAEELPELEKTLVEERKSRKQIKK